MPACWLCAWCLAFLCELTGCFDSGSTNIYTDQAVPAVLCTRMVRRGDGQNPHWPEAPQLPCTDCCGEAAYGPPALIAYRCWPPRPWTRLQGVAAAASSAATRPASTASTSSARPAAAGPAWIHLRLPLPPSRQWCRGCDAAPPGRHCCPAPCGSSPRGAGPWPQPWPCVATGRWPAGRWRVVALALGCCGADEDGVGGRVRVGGSREVHWHWHVGGVRPGQR